MKMKSFTSILSLLFLATALQGCLPDSFKKFKQEAPKSSDGASVDEPTPTPTPDPDFDPEGINFPSKISYASVSADDAEAQNFLLQKGRTLEVSGTVPHPEQAIPPLIDGDLSILSSYRTYSTQAADDLVEKLGMTESGRGFSVTDSPQPHDPSQGHYCDTSDGPYESSLPNGLELDSSKGAIKGTPQEISTNGGEPRNYCIRMDHKDEDGDPAIKEVAIKIGIYQKLPSGGNTAYENSDRMILELTELDSSIDVFSANGGNNVATTSEVANNPESENASVTFIDSQTSQEGENDIINRLFINRSGTDLYFSVGKKIDNNTFYQSKEARVSKATYVYQVEDSIDLKPRYSKFLCVNADNEVANYTSAQDCYDNIGSCSVATCGAGNDEECTTRTDCTGQGGTWTAEGAHNDSYVDTPYDSIFNDQYLLPSYFDSSNGVKFFIDRDLPPTLSFNQNTGKLSGQIDAPLSETTFNVLAINPLHPDYDTAAQYEDVNTNTTSEGNVVTTSFNLAVVQPPEDISVSNTQILQMNSIANYDIGDRVSIPDQENQAVGVVIDKIVADANPDKVYDYLVVRHAKGRLFEAGDTVDNKFPYGAAKGTVYAAEAIDAIFTVNDNDIDGFEIGENISNNSAQGIVRLRSEDGDSDGDPLDMGADNDKLYVRLTSPDISNQFSSGDTIDDQNAANYDGTDTEGNILDIRAPSLSIVTQSTLGANEEGSPIVSDDASPAIGTIHGHDSTTNYVTVETLGDQGFNANAGTAQDLDTENPHSGAGSLGDLQSVETLPTIYHYKDDYLDLKLNIDEGQDLSYKIDPELPEGLEFDKEELVISGTPIDRLDKTNFTVTAANSAGSTSFTFSLRIYDYFSLALNPPDEVEYDSYILHKAGKGNKITDCRVTREQINSDVDAVKDIDCYLDAGESELYHKGMRFDVKMGFGLCPQVSRDDYWFYRYPTSQTDTRTGTGDTELFRHVGDATDSDQCNLPTYSTFYEDTHNPRLGDINNANSNTINDPTMNSKPLCLASNGGGNFASETDLGTDLPNCDEGGYTEETISWSQQEFVCEDSSGNVTQDETAEECIENNGFCDCPDTVDCGGEGCDTRTACEDDNGEWVFSNPDGGPAEGGEHNDPTHTYQNPDNTCTGTTNPYTGSGGNVGTTNDDFGTCSATSNGVNEISCGGEKSECIDGAQREAYERENFDLTRLGNGIVTSVAPESSGFTVAFEGPEDKSHKTNMYLSNQFSDQSCVSNNYTLDNAGMSDYASNNTSGSSCTGSDNDCAKLGGTGCPSKVACENNNGTWNTTGTMFSNNAQPFYKYICQDGSGTTKAKITLHVREWNDSFSSNDNIDYAMPINAFTGSPEVMDATGTDSFGESLNTTEDIWDFEDGGDMCTNENIGFDFLNKLGTDYKNYPVDSL